MLRIFGDIFLDRRLQWLFELGQPVQFWPRRPRGRAGDIVSGRGILKSDLKVNIDIEAYDLTQNRADFWALAGIAAVDKGIENANEDCDSDDCTVPDSGLTFQWGRQVSVPGIRS